MKKTEATTKDPSYAERVKIALKAFESGCVIYSPDTSQWFTPREYVESGLEVRYTQPFAGHIQSNVVLHPPLNAVQHHIDKAIRSNEELKLFIKRIEQAFRLHPVKTGKA